MTETIVTRGSQITLTQEIRKKLNIKEGDVIVVNTIGSLIIATKKNPNIFRDVGEFLPENFEKIIKRIRADSADRLKRFGII